jgi:hypothetical protein
MVGYADALKGYLLSEMLIKVSVTFWSMMVQVAQVLRTITQIGFWPGFSNKNA